MTMSSTDHHVQDTKHFPKRDLSAEHKAMFILCKIKIRHSGISLHTSRHKATSKCFFVRKSDTECAATTCLQEPFLKPQADWYSKLIDKLLHQFWKVMIMFLNKVLTSHFWTNEEGQAHNNMPKIVFVNNSINCLKGPSLENAIIPILLNSLHGFPHYNTINNIHGFSLEEADISVWVKVDATEIESSPTTGSETSAKWFWIRDGSDICSAEMHLSFPFYKSNKNIAQDHFVPNTIFQWSIKIYGQIKIWFH